MLLVLQATRTREAASRPGSQAGNEPACESGGGPIRPLASQPGGQRLWPGCLRFSMFNFPILHFLFFDFYIFRLINFSIFQFLTLFHFSIYLIVVQIPIFQFPPYCAESFNFQFQFSKLKVRNLRPLCCAQS